MEALCVAGEVVTMGTLLFPGTLVELVDITVREVNRETGPSGGGAGPSFR